MNTNNLDQVTDNAPECDDDPELETIYARESAPLEIGSLIRSKEDALSLHKVIRGHVIEMRGLGHDQCKSLGNLIENRWNSPDFSERDANAIKALTTELNHLYAETYDDYFSLDDAAEYGAVNVVLDALSFAASFLDQNKRANKNGIAD